jgi:hypothetical protein
VKAFRVIGPAGRSTHRASRVEVLDGGVLALYDATGLVVLYGRQAWLRAEPVDEAEVATRP